MNDDFLIDSLFLAELGYLREREAYEQTNQVNVKEQKVGTTPSKDTSDLPSNEDFKEVAKNDSNRRAVPGGCEYGTHCWVLKNNFWLNMSTALGSILGGPLKAAKDPTIEDAQPAAVEERAKEAYNMRQRTEYGGKNVIQAKGAVQEDVRGTSELASYARDWHPRCRHCERPNEYGRSMCDPVLPRICQDASGHNSGDGLKRQQNDTGNDNLPGDSFMIPLFF